MSPTYNEHPFWYRRIYHFVLHCLHSDGLICLVDDECSLLVSLSKVAVSSAHIVEGASLVFDQHPFECGGGVVHQGIHGVRICSLLTGIFAFQETRGGHLDGLVERGHSRSAPTSLVCGPVDLPSCEHPFGVLEHVHLEVILLHVGDLHNVVSVGAYIWNWKNSLIRKEGIA